MEDSSRGVNNDLSAAMKDEPASANQGMPGRTNNYTATDSAAGHCTDSAGVVPRQMVLSNMVHNSTSIRPNDHDGGSWTSSIHGVVASDHQLAMDCPNPNNCNDMNTVSTIDPSSTNRILPKATPSPPKTAFMCFSISRTKGVDSTKTLDFDALADEYKRLPLTEKRKWEAEAQKDKQRYSEEKSGHQGPWQLPVRRAKKHPLAPKRPMSAFLRYSKCLRNKVKAENPHVDNTDISRLLGHMWRNATPEEKEPFVQQELKERSIYKVEMAKWRMMQKKMEIELALSNNGPSVSYQHHDIVESPDTSDIRYLPEDFRTIDFHTPEQYNKPFVQESEETTSSYHRNHSGYHPAPYYDSSYGYQETSSKYYNYYDTKRYDQWYTYADNAPPRFDNCGSVAVDSSSEGYTDHFGSQEDFHGRHSCMNNHAENSRNESNLQRRDNYYAKHLPYHYPTQNDSGKYYDHDERFHPKRRAYSQYWDRSAGSIREFQEPSSHSSY